MSTLRELYNFARREFAAADVPTGDCAILAEEFLGADRGYILLHGEEEAASEKAEKFIKWIEDLKHMMNIPIGLDVIEDKDVNQIIKWAMKEANPLYPVPKLMTRKELETFYYKIADWSK